MSASPGPWTAPLRRVEYERLVEDGVLDDQRVQLLDERLVRLAPESAEHAAVVDLIAEQLRSAAARHGLRVRIGHPVALSAVDEPEPDIAVVQARDDLYRDRHPTAADLRLAIEVARSSIALDLSLKASRYAAAAVPEYWVVDLARGRVIVHRGPDPRLGRWRSSESIAFGDPIEPLDIDVRIRVR